METISQDLLLQATEAYYAWDLTRSYHIYRRFFDRLPFEVLPEHADHISRYVRILVELGKKRELEFYEKPLEKWERKNNQGWITYTLAVVYYYQEKFEASKILFQKILDDAESQKLHSRTRMFLANYYDRFEKNFKKCEEMIRGINTEQEPDLLPLKKIWEAILLARSGKKNKAISIYQRLLSQHTLPRDWYIRVSAKLSLTEALIDKGEIESARAHYEEVLGWIEGKRFRSIEISLKGISQKLAHKKESKVGKHDSVSRLGL